MSPSEWAESVQFVAESDKVGRLPGGFDEAFAREQVKAAIEAAVADEFSLACDHFSKKTSAAVAEERAVLAEFANRIKEHIRHGHLARIPAVAEEMAIRARGAKTVPVDAANLQDATSTGVSASCDIPAAKAGGVDHVADRFDTIIELAPGAVIRSMANRPAPVIPDHLG